jgi:hypothetical protein
MTPKEKAEELVNSFELALRPIFGINQYDTEKLYYKDCALIAVDEILKDQNGDDTTIGNKTWWWQEVKQEIEKL